MEVGQKAVMVKTITAADIQQHAVLTRDGIPKYGKSEGDKHLRGE